MAALTSTKIAPSKTNSKIGVDGGGGGGGGAI